MRNPQSKSRPSPDANGKRIAGVSFVIPTAGCTVASFDHLTITWPVSSNTSSLFARDSLVAYNLDRSQGLLATYACLAQDLYYKLEAAATSFLHRLPLQLT